MGNGFNQLIQNENEMRMKMITCAAMFDVVSQVSLALHMDWVEPAFSFSREDVEPAKRVLDFRVGWFAEPIFGRGDYPLGMRTWLRQLNSLEYKFNSYFIYYSHLQTVILISLSCTLDLF